MLGAGHTHAALLRMWSYSDWDGGQPQPEPAALRRSGETARSAQAFGKWEGGRLGWRCLGAPEALVDEPVVSGAGLGTLHGVVEDKVVGQQLLPHCLVL